MLTRINMIMLSGDKTAVCMDSCPCDQAGKPSSIRRSCIYQPAIGTMLAVLLLQHLMKLYQLLYEDECKLSDNRECQAAWLL